jgi:hypothetical protein
MIMNKQNNYLILKNITSNLNKKTKCCRSFSRNLNPLNNKQDQQTNVLTGNKQIDDTLFKLKVFELMSVYEEAIGLKDIKEAQQSVLDVSSLF